MAVRVAGADLDHGRAGAQAIEQSAQSVVGAAVVSDLQDLDRR